LAAFMAAGAAPAQAQDAARSNNEAEVAAALAQPGRAAKDLETPATTLGRRPNCSAPHAIRA
jgi:hypothetical protein